MIETIERWWNEIWFRPASRTSFVEMRIIVAAQALWIVASRWQLPTVVGWSPDLWRFVPRRLLYRFGYFVLNPAVEWMLYALLVLSILCVLFGLWIRSTAFVGGVLLFHFAPLQSLLASGDFISMTGLTVSTLAMFVIWAAEGSEEYRWPVVFAQLFLSISFLLSGVMKLRYVGLRWYTGSNLSQIALTSWSLSDRPAALWIANHPMVSWMVALGSATLDGLFVFAVFSRPLRWIVVPLAIVAAAVRSAAFGYHWLAMPLLLLFVDWDRVVARLRRGPVAPATVF